MEGRDRIKRKELVKKDRKEKKDVERSNSGRKEEAGVKRKELREEDRRGKRMGEERMTD